MSHGRSPLDVDAVDAELDDILTVAVLPLGVVLPALLAEDDYLLAAGLAEDGRDDRGAAHRRSTDDRAVAPDHEHLAEGDLVLVGAAEHVTLDEQPLALRNAVLLSPGTNDGVHNDLRKMEPRFVTHGEMPGQRPQLCRARTLRVLGRQRESVKGYSFCGRAASGGRRAGREIE